MGDVATSAPAAVAEDVFERPVFTSADDMDRTSKWVCRSWFAFAISVWGSRVFSKGEAQGLNHAGTVVGPVWLRTC